MRPAPRKESGRGPTRPGDARGAAARHERWEDLVPHRLSVDDRLVDITTRRQLEHHVVQDFFADSAQSTRARASIPREIGDGGEGVVDELELDVVDAEEL